MVANEVRLIDMNTLWQCETCFHHYPNGCDTYCDHGENYRPAADMLTVIDPESLRPKGWWISVEDRLPTDGVRVLTACDDGIVRLNVSKGGFPAVINKQHRFAEATHWMPLPEPPMEE